MEKRQWIGIACTELWNGGIPRRPRRLASAVLFGFLHRRALTWTLLACFWLTTRHDLFRLWVRRYLLIDIHSDQNHPTHPTDSKTSPSKIVSHPVAPTVTLSRDCPVQIWVHPVAFVENSSRLVRFDGPSSCFVPIHHA